MSFVEDIKLEQSIQVVTNANIRSEEIFMEEHNIEFRFEQFESLKDEERKRDVFNLTNSGDFLRSLSPQKRTEIIESLNSILYANGLCYIVNVLLNFKKVEVINSRPFVMNFDIYDYKKLGHFVSEKLTKTKTLEDFLNVTMLDVLRATLDIYNVSGEQLEIESKAMLKSIMRIIYSSDIRGLMNSFPTPDMWYKTEYLLDIQSNKHRYKNIYEKIQSMIDGLVNKPNFLIKVISDYGCSISSDQVDSIMNKDALVDMVFKSIIMAENFNILSVSEKKAFTDESGKVTNIVSPIHIKFGVEDDIYIERKSKDLDDILIKSFTNDDAERFIIQ